MKTKNPKIKKILEKYKEISILGKVEALLSWDLNVNLPPKASEGRAIQSAYLTKLVSDKWLGKEFRNLLEDLNAEIKKLETEEQAIIRNLNEAGKFYFRVPQEIIVEFSESTSKAFISWQKAKLENNFKEFEPHLIKLVNLNQIIANHLGYKDNPYDALLDLYEPGLTSASCRTMFSKLKPFLTSTINKISKTKKYAEQSDLVDGSIEYSQDDQKQVSLFILRKMGYDMDAGRMDISTHPFTQTLGRFDVRITNRYKRNDFRDSVGIAMHEAGHALYEQGIKEEYEYTPLDGGVSLGIHESQSRFWENQVGRSAEFISFVTPIFHAFYPNQLSKVGEETIHYLFNQVRPSLIRTESDEVTYNLHIALRFELEEAMINGKIKVGDLPEIWREKMKKYLGVAPKTDREGVLQDVHWSHGPMGYFPTYTLGNLYAAQITKKMSDEIDVEKSIEKGELGTLLFWLRTHIHQYGSLYWPDELCQKVTGENLNPKYFMEYIKDKYSQIYQTKLG